MYSQVQKTKEECEHRTMKEQILESQSVTLQVTDDKIMRKPKEVFVSF